MEQGRTVLVVDDEPQYRRLVGRLLGRLGYTVVEAGDGIEALVQARSSSPDVILLDLNMPGLEGRDILAALKADSALQHVPVLIVTGALPETEQAAEYLRLGADDFVRKTQEASELEARVEAACRTKAHRDQLVARNHDLERQACDDELTGLHNRRGLLTIADHLCGAARHSRQNLATVFIDLDGLKAINDTRGHAAGDVAIRALAALIRATARSADVAARLGGDEFCVLLPGSDRAEAEHFVDRLRAAVAIWNEQAGEKLLAFSVGIAERAWDDPRPIDDLIASADLEMYRDKESRRLSLR